MLDIFHSDIIIDNESFVNLNSHKTTSVSYIGNVKDNILFQHIIADYSRTISGLKSYIIVLDTKIDELKGWLNQIIYKEKDNKSNNGNSIMLPLNTKKIKIDFSKECEFYLNKIEYFYKLDKFHFKTFKAFKTFKYLFKLHTHVACAKWRVKILWNGRKQIWCAFAAIFLFGHLLFKTLFQEKRYTQNKQMDSLSRILLSLKVKE